MKKERLFVDFPVKPNRQEKLNIILPEKKGIRPGDWVKITAKDQGYPNQIGEVTVISGGRLIVSFNGGYDEAWFLLDQVKKLRRRAEIRTVKSGKNKGQFYVELIGDNGEPLDDVYTTKAMARKTLKKYFPSFAIREQ